MGRQLHGKSRFQPVIPRAIALPAVLAARRSKGTATPSRFCFAADFRALGECGANLRKPSRHIQAAIVKQQSGGKLQV